MIYNYRHELLKQKQMNEIILFGISVILISASGVLVPGPLFIANIMYGMKDGLNAGIKMAHGHAIVELPLIVLLGIGLFSLKVFPQLEVAIAIIGSLGLFVFGGMQIINIITNKQNDGQVIIKKTGGKKYSNPFLIGAMFTAFNPFFIIWWLTIGFKLIFDATSMWSYTGIIILFGFHIWMDYIWLGSTAFFSKKSNAIFSNNVWRILTIILSGVLIYFGISFLLDIF